MPGRKRRRRGGDEDEVQELTEMHIERVDAVTEPATRLPFLLVKAEDDEEAIPVAELLRKAKDEDEETYGYPEADEEEKAAARGKAGGETYGYPEAEEKARVAYPAPHGQPAKKQEGEAEAGAPGSQAWEQQDASILQQAVKGLLAIKQLLKQALQREQIEQASGHGEWADMNLLFEAMEELTEALSAVAGAAALEEAEAGEGEAKSLALAKAGRVMSRKNMERLHAAMHHMVRAAGFGSIEDFAKAAKEMGFAKTDEENAQGDEAEKAKAGRGKAKAKPAAEDDEAREEEEAAEKGGKGKTETKKSFDASDERPEASVVIKALEATGLVDLAKSAGDLLKAVESVQRLEERVKALEEQPMPGGPMLRGRATMSDYYLVRKGDAVEGIQGGETLEKALEQISDPYLRDALARELAKSLHPALQQKG